jgi:hypothetical protein
MVQSLKFEPLMDPKATRREDLTGHKELIYYCKPGDPTFTHYTGFFTGKQVPEAEKAKVLDTFTYSAMQMPSPDPVSMRKSKQRRDKFLLDTRNIALKMPLTMMLTKGFFKPKETRSQSLVV